MSLILSAPAILLVTSGLFYSVFGIPQLMEALDFELIVFRPVVLMGGLLLAADASVGPRVVRYRCSMHAASCGV